MGKSRKKQQTPQQYLNAGNRRNKRLFNQQLELAKKDYLKRTGLLIARGFTNSPEFKAVKKRFSRRRYYYRKNYEQKVIQQDLQKQQEQKPKPERPKTKPEPLPKPIRLNIINNEIVYKAMGYGGSVDRAINAFISEMGENNVVIVVRQYTMIGNAIDMESETRADSLLDFELIVKDIYEKSNRYKSNELPLVSAYAMYFPDSNRFFIFIDVKFRA